MNLFLNTVNGMQEILAICPCCHDLFRLVDGKLILLGKAPRKDNPYQQMIALTAKAVAADDSISQAEGKFLEKFEVQRERLSEVARRTAKKRLRKIDAIFTKRQIDHQDVKVIFDPVEYVIFKGLSEKDKISEIRLVSRKPASSKSEKVLRSIEQTVKQGNLSFETLHLKNDGSFEVESRVQ